MTNSQYEQLRADWKNNHDGAACVRRMVEAEASGRRAAPWRTSAVAHQRRVRTPLRPRQL